jgi:glycosyltransferase involved in cell wall biosynthesis/SAM-dependent methyltransferase
VKSSVLVSVVMPSFNQCGFIEQAIRSVFAQNCSSLELIVMDGGSTDGTAALLKRLQNEFGDRLYWESEPDLGPAHAINKAFTRAKGAYLGWINSDDLMAPGAVSAALDYFERNSTKVMVYGEGEHIDVHGHFLNRYPTLAPDVGIEQFQAGCFICQPTVFLRSSVLQAIGLLDQSISTAFDFEFWLRVFKRFPEAVGFLPRVQAYSRLHDDCITQKMRRTVALDGLRVLHMHLGYAQPHWLLTYVDELYQDYPNNLPTEDIRVHVNALLMDANAFLTAADKEMLKSRFAADKRLSAFPAGVTGGVFPDGWVSEELVIRVSSECTSLVQLCVHGINSTPLQAPLSIAIKSNSGLARTQMIPAGASFVIELPVGLSTLQGYHEYTLTPSQCFTPSQIDEKASDNRKLSFRIEAVSAIERSQNNHYAPDAENVKNTKMVSTSHSFLMDSMMKIFSKIKNAFCSVSVDDVRWCYQHLLGREPESESVIKSHLKAKNFKALVRSFVLSKEFLGSNLRLNGAVAGVLNSRQVPDEHLIDVRERMRTYSVTELNEAAEIYFQQHLSSPQNYLKKPFLQVNESAHQLLAFTQMLNGLAPLPGMRLLDFGAGTCWATRFFADFKLDVVACDVSPSALEIGKQIFARNPVLGTPFKPNFLVFDGYKINLPDNSVDRIACFDAFHHVPNPDVVLRELARVLKPGGIAGFSEPGPHHSKTGQSQYEMKNYKVIENDIILGEIWDWAQAAGFTNLRVAINNPLFHSVDYPEFCHLVEKGGEPLRAYAEHVHTNAVNEHIFFLYKGDPALPDSRKREGLAAELTLPVSEIECRPQAMVEGKVFARNIGTNRWLPSAALFGPVKLGLHLKAANGNLVDINFGRVKLPGNKSVEPGEVVEIPFVFKAPTEKGKYVVELDMVSEDVCWFEVNNSTVASITLNVI